MTLEDSGEKFGKFGKCTNESINVIPYVFPYALFSSGLHFRSTLKMRDGVTGGPTDPRTKPPIEIPGSL